MDTRVARTLAAVCCAAPFLIPGHASALQNDSVHRDDERGVVLRVPGKNWKRTTGSQASNRWVQFDSEADDGTRIALQTFTLPPETLSLAQLCDSELSHWRRTGTADEISREARTVEGVAAFAVRFRLKKDDERRLVDVTYAIRNGVVYRVSATVALEDEARLPDWVASALAGVEWTKEVRETTAAPIPFETETPIARNVLTIVHASGPDAPYRYLEALPGAARANGGLPIVLVVGERLTPSTRTFLSKYRPERIRIVGAPHPELTRAEAAVDAWPPGGTVVIAARNLADAVPAAALAQRLNAPLVVADADLDARLASLRATRHIVVGTVAELPPQLGGVEFLGNPLAVAGRSGGGTYVALCNVAEGTGNETAVFAAALAGVHEGVVLPITERVRVHRGALSPTSIRPAGFVDESTNRWVTGALRVDGRELSVAAAVMGRLRISGAESDRFGRPRVDLDGDGRFDAAGEEIRVGSTIRLADRPFAFSVRYQTVLGRPGPGEALLVEPDPESVRESIRAFVDRLGRAEHLAIVGTPDRIPFAILESESYFSTLDIKQELASDAPYANLDDDPSLELAVGRVLVPDLESGSAILATSLAYPRLEGDWVGRASLLAPGFASAEGRNSLYWVWPESESLARSLAGGLREAGIECDSFLRDRVDVGDVLASMRGAGWIGHMNHSNETTWGIKPGSHIGAADLPDLDGAPIVVDTGCSSGGIDLGVPLAATLPGRFFALGAVVYIGNTRPASLGAEVAVQQMFNRIVSDGATVGQAYRDGRNLLAHLLVHGQIDPDLGTFIFDKGVYERAWSQFTILNLFGDPGLVPRRQTIPDRPLVDVRLEETSRPDRLRLVVSRNAEDRVDPLLIVPAAGQGTPRDAFLRTAPGLSYGAVPHFYLDRGALSPLRAPLVTAPGAWVDVALPSAARDVEIALVEGPAWADRGFSVETDPNGEARLRAYVPFVRSSLETGSGETLSHVVFDVILSGTPGDAPAPRREFRTTDFSSAEPRRARGRIGRVSASARPLWEKIDARRHDPWARGLARLEIDVANPGSKILKDTRARISAARGEEEEPRCELSALPPRMASHEAEVEDAFRFVYDFVVNDPLGYLLSGEYTVDLERREKGKAVLRLEPTSKDEGNEVATLVVTDAGRIERLHRRRFGVEEVTHFVWRSLREGEGDVVSRLTTDEVSYGQPRVIDVEYDDAAVRGAGPRLPSRITVAVPGLFAQPFEFRPRYERVERAGRGDRR